MPDKYLEYRKRIIRCICPSETRTIEKQNKQINGWPGVTLVMYLNGAPLQTLQQRIEQISALGYSFESFGEQLHVTLLGLFEKEDENRGPILDYDELLFWTRRFFTTGPEYVRRLLSPVKFTEIRPGYSSLPDRSDGTVVATPDKACRKFIEETAVDLGYYLSGSMPRLFPEAARRKQGGVWCTLGYFKEKVDFTDSTDLKATNVIKLFKSPEFTQPDVSMEFKQLSVVDFRVKSLKSGIRRGEILLS